MAITKMKLTVMLGVTCLFTFPVTAHAQADVDPPVIEHIEANTFPKGPVFLQLTKDGNPEASQRFFIRP